MYIDEITEYCLSKPETKEDFPFDKQTLVFKVCGKMFALMDIDSPTSINLKCEPEYAIELREHHPEITAGYHMSKKHWNTVSLTGKLTNDFVKELITHSYLEVVKGLKKAEKDAIYALLKE